VDSELCPRSVDAQFYQCCVVVIYRWNDIGALSRNDVEVHKSPRTCISFDEVRKSPSLQLSDNRECASVVHVRLCTQHCHNIPDARDERCLTCCEK